jgi:hypothetical protein
MARLLMLRSRQSAVRCPELRWRYDRDGQTLGVGGNS